MEIGDTTCESISKTAQSSASCSDLRASAASGYLCTFPRWVPIAEEAHTSSSWRFDAYAGGKRGLACYLARTWIRTLKLRPHSGSETATLGFNLQLPQIIVKKITSLNSGIYTHCQVYLAKSESLF